jgi:bla regulator protein BlaR1
LFLIWGTTVCGLLALFVRRLVQVGQLIRSSAPADERLEAVFQEARQALGRGHVPVELRVSSLTEVPAICGFWQPTILIPRSLPEKLDRDQLRLILAHELIHWQRGDL